MYRAPLVEGSSINKDKNPDNKLKRPSDLQQWGNEAMELSGELNHCSNSIKKQSVRACIELSSPKNEVVSNKQRVRDSEEATEPPSSDISKRISLVEMIYSKRIGKLLANQSKKSLQFKEARDRIKNDLTKKLLNEHSNASVLVRKMHPGIDARIVGLKNVDKEFIKKEQLIKTHLNTEQVKLDANHEADRKEERKLKSHWMHEAKSGRSVDAYSILPQFLDSCFNLDDLKNCEQVHFVEGTVSHGLLEMGVAWHSEVVRGCSPPVGEGTIPTEPSATAHIIV
ncbi:hypothetical protein MKX03_013321 [Papaver bracteatum]|nr:hypothetical protein MKX03_013321 [Papaver bracteatum]